MKMLTSLVHLGNYVDEFADNVLAPVPFGSIFAGYQCPTDENCEDA